jgi:cytochrome c biogenesis protein CcmG/thiol:disulfide interchange protein DsbE
MDHPHGAGTAASPTTKGRFCVVRFAGPSLLLLIILMVGAGVVVRAATEAPATTSETPALDVSPWKGRVVLLDFWASWCEPCRQSFPWMAQMHGRYGEKGLVVVAVNLDQEPEPAARFLEDFKGDFVHVQDPAGRLAQAYGLTVMPTSILIDREGRPVFRHEGFRPGKEDEYERHLVELLENRGPAKALTIGTAKAPRFGVHPWERGALADPAMQLNPDPLEAELDDHIYFSKEASSGGRGFGGGGCGCN